MPSSSEYALGFVRGKRRSQQQIQHAVASAGDSIGFDIRDIDPKNADYLLQIPEKARKKLGYDPKKEYAENKDGLISLLKDGRPIATWRAIEIGQIADFLSAIAAIYAILKDRSVFKEFFKRVYRKIMDLIFGLANLTLTSYGSIHTDQMDRATLEALKSKADTENLVITTGWGGRARRNTIKREFDIGAIVQEGATIAHIFDKDTEEYTTHLLFTDTEEPLESSKHDTNTARDIFNEDPMRNMRRVWNYTFDSIVDVETNPVLFSQGNEYGVCVYINSSLKDIIKFPTPNPESVSVAELIQRKERDASTISELDRAPMEAAIDDILMEELGAKRGRIENSIDGKYVLEKLNAQLREFKPYRITLVTDDWITFELLDIIDLVDLESVVNPIHPPDNGSVDKMISAIESGERPDKPALLRQQIKEIDAEGVRPARHYEPMAPSGKHQPPKAFDRIKRKFITMINENNEPQYLIDRFALQSNSIDIFVRKKEEGIDWILDNFFDKKRGGKAVAISRGTPSDKDFYEEFVERIEELNGQPVIHAPSNIPDDLRVVIDEIHTGAQSLKDVLSDLDGDMVNTQSSPLDY